MTTARLSIDDARVIVAGLLHDGLVADRLTPKARGISSVAARRGGGRAAPRSALTLRPAAALSTATMSNRTACSTSIGCAAPDLFFCVACVRPIHRWRL